LIPYRILIREGIPAVMTGHLAFPRILGSLTPASLSPYFLQSLLRDKLGFRGIVITDDKEMEGVLADGLDTPTACLRALEAGNDMVLVSHTPATQELTWKALAAAARSRKAFRSSLKESVTRILATKLRFARSRNAPADPDPSAVRMRVPAPGARDFFVQVSARAVTLIKGKRIPYRPARGERILLCGQFNEFIEEGLRRFPGADTLLFPFNPFYGARAQDKAAARSRAAGYDTVIFCLANFNSLDVLQELKGLGEKVIVISALSPVYLTDASWVQTAVAVYGDGRDSFRAGFGVLAGDFAATGLLPVSFAAQAAK
ncbi:MAG TPA: glycoside hydrolase family 3 N-terminal domain-containing protein, partial [Spirochaetia bacterium]|nr:glycoside hydrolase family 3 N-terminal domain-containing protein [Spirochaetia bacterium]